jgi:two-component system, response regulator RegA
VTNIPIDITDRSLLLTEDDKPFREHLDQALEARGFTVTACENLAQSLSQLEADPPAFAVVDLQLGDGNGLRIVELLKRKRPEARSVVLTGYGDINIAVTAIKAGATNFLLKPADADDVVSALLATSEPLELPANIKSADRVWWEHIQRIYEMSGRNISEAARRLKLHRRSLQRILGKKAPK